MLRLKFVLLVLALAVEVLGVPIDNWDDDALMDEVSMQNSENSTINSVDMAILQKLGITDAFLEELKINLEKAIEVERLHESRYRQGNFGGGGGGIGDLYGVGGGGFGQGQGGGGGGFGQGQGQGQGGQQEDEEDEEPAPPASPGPGVFGILSGLFGIFSGIGSLNPRRVIQSTVNFFPPDRRIMAQTALDEVFGVHNVTTLRPLTDAPPATTTLKTGLEREDLNETTISVSENEIKATTTEKIKVVESTSTRKALRLKETSLEEDFEEAANQFNPKETVEKGSAKDLLPTPSSLEKDFAETIEQFKIGSFSESEHGDSAASSTNGTENKLRTDSIEKDFQDTGLVLTL